MITKIGITAGAIWNLLDRQGGAELSEIFSSLDGSRDLILMGLGWLVREGYVVVEKNKKRNRVFLRKDGQSAQEDIKCPDFREGKHNACLAFREVLMTPSIFEIKNYCLGGKYKDCPWRLKSKSIQN